MSSKKLTNGRAQRFGGDWTTSKLDVIAQYLASYTTALKDKPSKEHPFLKGYIDAFAGTGYRDVHREDDSSQSLFLPDLAGPEPKGLLDGSARRALKTSPRFDRYVFIERNADRCAQLEQLKHEFPELAPDVLAPVPGTHKALTASRGGRLATRMGAEHLDGSQCRFSKPMDPGVTTFSKPFPL